jgi:hypothetical protein
MMDEMLRQFILAALRNRRPTTYYTLRDSVFADGERMGPPERWSHAEFQHTVVVMLEQGELRLADGSPLSDHTDAGLDLAHC